MSDETVKIPSHEEYFGSAPTVKKRVGRQASRLVAAVAQRFHKRYEHKNRSNAYRRRKYGHRDVDSA